MVKRFRRWWGPFLMGVAYFDVLAAAFASVMQLKTTCYIFLVSGMLLAVAAFLQPDHHDG